MIMILSDATNHREQMTERLSQTLVIWLKFCFKPAGDQLTSSDLNSCPAKFPDLGKWLKFHLLLLPPHWLPSRAPLLSNVQCMWVQSSPEVFRLSYSFPLSFLHVFKWRTPLLVWKLTRDQNLPSETELSMLKLIFSTNICKDKMEPKLQDCPGNIQGIKRAIVISCRQYKIEWVSCSKFPLATDIVYLWWMMERLNEWLWSWNYHGNDQLTMTLTLLEMMCLLYDSSNMPSHESNRSTWRWQYLTNLQ